MEVKDWIGSAVIILLGALLVSRKRNAQSSIFEVKAVQAEQNMWQNTVITLTERIEALTQEVQGLRRENEELKGEIQNLEKILRRSNLSL
jgi:cell division protein FtsB